MEVFDGKNQRNYPFKRAHEIGRRFEFAAGRPGAPTWGRPNGRVTAAAQSITPEDRVTMSATDQLENAKSPVYNAKAELSNKTEMNRAKVVDELAKKFFEGQAPAQVAKGMSTLSEDRLDSFDQSREVARPTE